MQIKYELVYSLVWSFNDQFNQVIHNSYKVKWPISFVEMNIYDPSLMCLQLIGSFSFGFHLSYFWYEKRCHEIFFFMKLWQLSLWLWHHTFQYIFAPPFPSQTSFRSKDFSALYPFWRMTFEELFLKKKTCEEIYRHKSMDVSRSSKTIDQSFMTNLKIYLQQSNIDF